MESKQNDNDERLAPAGGSAAGGRYYALIRGRSIPYDMGGGNAEIPWELKSKTYDEAQAEAKARYGESLYNGVSRNKVVAAERAHERPRNQMSEGNETPSGSLHAVVRRRCRYCGAYDSELVELRYERGLYGQAFYDCRDIEACRDRLRAEAGAPSNAAHEQPPTQ